MPVRPHSDKPANRSSLTPSKHTKQAPTPGSRTQKRKQGKADHMRSQHRG